MVTVHGHLEHILPDAKSVIAHIDKQYGICYSASGVTDLLRRLDPVVGRSRNSLRFHYYDIFPLSDLDIIHLSSCRCRGLRGESWSA